MNESLYNQLPENIKQKFQIIYSELIYDNTIMFKNIFEKWGVLTMNTKMGLFSTYEYIVEAIYNSTGFNKDLKLIEVVKYENDVWDKDKNTFLYFDVKGNKIWQSQKGESVRTDKFRNIFLRRQNRIGLLDRNFSIILEPKYERLSAINNYYLKAFKDGGYGIVNKEDKEILEFEYSEIFDSSINNKVLVKKQDGKYFSFELHNRSLSKLPFDKILQASSNTYKAPSQESLKYYKSITNLKENQEFDEYDYEMVSYKGKWGIIDGAGKVIIPNDYSFVDFFRNPNYFKVGIGEIDVIEYVDKNQNYRTAIKNVKWGVVDINNNIVVPIEYEWIDEVEATVWVVYKGGTVFYNDDYQEDYWTIENGKLGVYNLAKLITPIEYDTIRKNWFRIKDYIFVQKELSYFDEEKAGYDVYTLSGNKIENKKPRPKDHTYYG